MTADELAEVQNVLKERYRNYPETAIATLEGRSVLGKDIHCIILLARWRSSQACILLLEAPVTTCARNTLLDSLSACAAITLSAVSIHMRIQIRSGTITAKGLLDLRGIL